MFDLTKVATKSVIRGKVLTVEVDYSGKEIFDGAFASLTQGCVQRALTNFFTQLDAKKVVVHSTEEVVEKKTAQAISTPAPKKRGRPRKVTTEVETAPKKKRGRPRKAMSAMSAAATGIPLWQRVIETLEADNKKSWTTIELAKNFDTDTRFIGRAVSALKKRNRPDLVERIKRVTLQ